MEPLLEISVLRDYKHNSLTYLFMKISVLKDYKHNSLIHLFMKIQDGWLKKTRISKFPFEPLMPEPFIIILRRFLEDLFLKIFWAFFVKTLEKIFKKTCEKFLSSSNMIFLAL